MKKLSHPWSRVCGVALAAIIMFFLDSDNSSQLHLLWLPLALAFCAWLMTRAFMAVAIATFALTITHLDIEATNWIEALAYPAIALISFVICCFHAIRRFRRHVIATHDARWAHRHPAGLETPQIPQRSKQT